MFLFKKDNKTNKYHIDTTTTNLSFIKMCKILKLLGISNNMFPLALIDRRLIGVDPFSKDLSSTTKLLITQEVMRNVWYFFREIVRLPGGGGRTVRFQLNRGNLAAIWLFSNNTNIFLTMPRQFGKTIVALCLSLRNIFLIGEGTMVGMFAKGNKLRVDNIARIKQIKELLPDYLVDQNPSATSNNQETIMYTPLATKYETFVATKDPIAADDQGRGGSYIFLHYDEFSHYSNNEASFSTASASTDRWMELAIQAGIPTAHMITTTTGYTSRPAGKYAYDFMNSCLPFSERLYDLENVEALNEVVKVGCGSGPRFVYVEFSHLQLGKDDEWLALKTAGKSPAKIDTDYLNKWIHGAANAVLTKNEIDKLQANVIEPISTVISNSILLNYYTSKQTLEDPTIRNTPFIIGGDYSDMAGKDFTTLVMTHPGDMSVVMTARCNISNTIKISKTILELLLKFPRAVWIPESNTAAAVMDYVIAGLIAEGLDPFVRIYNRYAQEKPEVDTALLDPTAGDVRNMFGFRTGASSRNQLYSNILRTIIDRNSDIIYDKSIVNELCGLVDRRGRIDHTVSGNDDTLIAYLIACWFIIYGKNLPHYGLDPFEFLNKVNKNDPDQNRVYAINRKAELLKALTSPNLGMLMRQTYQREMRDIENMLRLTKADANEDAFSVSQVAAEQEVAQPKYSLSDTIGSIGSLFG